MRAETGIILSGMFKDRCDEAGRAVRVAHLLMLQPFAGNLILCQATLTNRLEEAKATPQGLKPSSFCGICGTTQSPQRQRLVAGDPYEVVPFQQSHIPSPDSSDTALKERQDRSNP
jgi:hypothetical protein